MATRAVERMSLRTEALCEAISENHLIERELLRGDVPAAIVTLRHQRSILRGVNQERGDYWNDVLAAGLSVLRTDPRKAD